MSTGGCGASVSGSGQDPGILRQEIGHGTSGLAKLAVVVEHPSSQHCLGGFFEPLVDQNSNFSAEILPRGSSGQARNSAAKFLMPNEDSRQAERFALWRWPTPRRTGYRQSNQ